MYVRYFFGCLLFLQDLVNTEIIDSRKRDLCSVKMGILDSWYCRTRSVFLGMVILQSSGGRGDEEGKKIVEETDTRFVCVGECVRESGWDKLKGY